MSYNENDTINKTEVESGNERNMQSISSEEKELDTLRNAYAELLDKISALNNENLRMQAQLKKSDAQMRKLLDENGRIKKRLSQEKAAAEKNLRRYEQVNAKYEALANSKLGRLTLNHWAKQSKKKGAGKGIAGLPAVEKYFDKLPTAQELDPEIAALDEVPVSADDANIDRNALETWVYKYDEAIEALPDSNGIRYYNKAQCSIGIIADEFFYESISDAADFVYVTPENYESVIAGKEIDVLLFVSAWRGLNNEWTGMAQLNSNRRSVALDLIAKCKENAIPTIFYSKEDPPNYERFIEYAKQCDCVFTSASECIPYYKEDCGHDRVYELMFGIDPAVHNPIGFYKEEKDKTVLFSGSWMEKYPNRCRELSLIFNGILRSDYDLHIVDRNYGNERYQYPPQYNRYASPAVDHKKLQKLHKQFDWAVNINSVTDSETMFANRTFELQAAGVLLLSNYSVGVNNVHPTVFMAHESLEVDKILQGFTDEERYEHQIAGIRSVMTGHTCFDRIESLLAPIGIDAAQPKRKILVIAQTLDDGVKASFERQTYENKTLMLQSEINGEVLSQYDMVTWFDAGAYYGEFYLEDMINAFKYTACDYITKDAYFKDDILNAGTEHNYVNKMRSAYRTVFWREAFDSEFFLSVPSECELPGGYSIDRFSYREGAHETPVREKPYLLSVIIPVYNNGAHLYGKCFASLRRSSMFDDMEIIMVDDGSTDERTLKIETYLSDRYANVKRYAFEDGGSGSASRPRNKGVELASAEHITFLDPDNEAIDDGYAQLYTYVCDENLDIAFGNIYRCTEKTQLFNYYYNIGRRAGTTFFEHGLKEYMARTDFYAVSIQAMIIRREIIMKNGFEQVPGAAGQDTLFCWQLFSCADRIRALEFPIHIYYAQTSGSVTNAVSTKFFDKLMLLQQPKIDWLISENLLEDYMRTRHDTYVKGWIFQKLSRAREEELCTKKVKEILDLYEPYYKRTDELINEFIKDCEDEKYNDAFSLVKKEFAETKKRPMPTLEELTEQIKADKQRQSTPKQFDIRYTINGSKVSLTNLSRSKKGAQYAWSVLFDTKTYKKVYVSKYTNSNNFSYDFSDLSEGKYKIRAFIMRGGDKISEDTLYITLTHDRIIFVNKNLSLAVEE
ncbi:MAG: glycosyltransferase [Clostridia bacterium]|nr:glycosyltransferase [Clostridia bacterium]